MSATVSSRLPLAVFFILFAAIALILSPLSCPAAAAMGNDYGGDRVGTIDRRGSRVAAAVATGAAAPSRKWQQRRLEEAVAPEFGSLLAADQGYINYDTLNKNRPACGNGCAARGASYTQQYCLAIYGCRG